MSFTGISCDAFTFTIIIFLKQQKGYLLKQQGIIDWKGNRTYWLIDLLKDHHSLMNLKILWITLLLNILILNNNFFVAFLRFLCGCTRYMNRDKLWGRLSIIYIAGWSLRIVWWYLTEFNYFNLFIDWLVVMSVGRVWVFQESYRYMWVKSKIVFFLLFLIFY